MSTNNNRPEHNELSRRNVLKLGFTALIAGLSTRMLLRPALAHASELPAGKILIAYYSRTGNTRAVAEQIHSRIGGELFEVHTTHSYPDAYRPTTEQAKREQESNFRPTLTAKVADMDACKTVFIGYPNWWGTLPMALFTFLESYDFAGKTIVPFCTHEGTGLGRGPSDIAKLCPTATLLDGFAVRGGSAASAQGNVDKWLKNINLL